MHDIICSYSANTPPPSLSVTTLPQLVLRDEGMKPAMAKASV